MDIWDLLIPSFTTPTPSFAKNQKVTAEGREFTMNSGKMGVRVVIQPDLFEPIANFDPGSDADTGCVIDTDVYTNVTYDTRNRVKDFIRKPFTIYIRTRYKVTMDPESNSVYGRGTTKADLKAGNQSLRFHESQHGVMCLNYINKNQIPDLKIKVGLSQKEIQGFVSDFSLRFNRYMTSLESYHIDLVDCSGKAAAFCGKH